jgi:CRP-like cAMP-binding protein
MRFRIHRQWEDSKLGALERSREFGWMHYRELREIAVFLDETTAPAGVVLITEGQLNHNFFLLISGVLEATHRGRHQVFLRPVETCGEIGLGSGEMASATIVTATPVRLLVAGQEQKRALGQLMESLAKGRATRLPSRIMVPNPA